MNEEIICRRLESIEDVVAGQPGDFCFDHIHGPAHSALCINIPNVGFLRLPLHRGQQNNHGWGWDGNEDAPTIEPIIHCHGHKEGDPDLWHGFFHAGKLKPC